MTILIRIFICLVAIFVVPSVIAKETTNIDDYELSFNDANLQQIDALRGAPELMLYSSTGKVLYQEGGILAQIEDVDKVIENLNKIAVKNEKEFLPKPASEHSEAARNSEKIILDTIESYMLDQQYPRNVVDHVLEEQKPKIAKALKDQVYTFEFLNDNLTSSDGKSLIEITKDMDNLVLVYFMGKDCTTCNALNVSLRNFFETNGIGVSILSVKRAQ